MSTVTARRRVDQSEIREKELAAWIHHTARTRCLYHRDVVELCAKPGTVVHQQMLQASIEVDELTASVIAHSVQMDAEEQEKYFQAVRQWNDNPRNSSWVIIGNTEFDDSPTNGSSFVPTNGPTLVKEDRATGLQVTQGGKGGKRYDIFGHPVTAVLRWMGQDAWTRDQARKALDELGLEDVAEPTIHAQLHAGRKGTRGEPAKLTDLQVEKLYALIEEDNE